MTTVQHSDDTRRVVVVVPPPAAVEPPAAPIIAPPQRARRTERRPVRHLRVAVAGGAEETVTFTLPGLPAGTHVLELLLDGRVAETRPIDLRGESSTDVAFTVTIDEPGTHTLQAVTVTFNVHQVERPPNGTVLANQIGGGANRLTTG